MSAADIIRNAVCNKLSAILIGNWVIQSTAFLYLGIFFYYLILFVPGEPVTRLVQWEGSYACVFAKKTDEAPEWWTTSISEYCAARGSSGAKLLGTSLGIAGVLQISNAVILRQVCALNWTATSLLLVGALFLIAIGQLEISDLNDDLPRMVTLKKLTGIGHMTSAIGFVCFTAAGVIVADLTWVSSGLAIGGAVGFALFYALKSLSGNNATNMGEAMFPQQPAFRNPLHPRYGRCHAWISIPSNRLLLGRTTLTIELTSVLLLIFATIFMAIYTSSTRNFCVGTAFGDCFR